MLSNLFDQYSLNARVRPALLGLLPIIVFAYVAIPKLYQFLAAITSVFVFFGLVTALAHVSRSRGRGVEKKLYKSWGGKPTTTMLRHRDDSLDPITKRRYHDYLNKSIAGWHVPSEDDELRNPVGADQAYESAVKWLLEKTRDTRKFTLLFKENISYGFRRNCYGIKWISISVAILSLIFSVFGIFKLFHISYDVGTVSLIVSALFSLMLFSWWFFVVTASWVKDAAQAYAIRLLAACEEIDL